MDLIQELMQAKKIFKNYDKEVLLDILSNRHETIQPLCYTNGAITLSTREVIPCVKELYAHKDKSPILGKNCFKIHQELSLDSPVNQCRLCHIECLNRIETDLRKLNKKRKKK